MDKKPNRLRKFFKIIVFIFLGLLILVSVLPYFFKGRIIEAAKNEINKQVEARVDFGDLSLSLIRNFPHFSCRLDDISVVGTDDFDGDTLASIHSLSVTIDLLSVFEGDQYRIRKIFIDKPDLLLIVNQDGKANWDITKESGAPDPETKPVETSDFVVTLTNLEIMDAKLDYLDRASGTSILIDGLRHNLSGDFTANSTNINTQTNIASATIYEGGVGYLTNAGIDFNAIIDADFKNEIYTFKRNSLKINELLLKFDGSIATVNDDINVTMTFQAPQNSFKNFLSLVPAIYKKDFQDLETSGKLSIDGHVKGTYNSQNLPSFRLNLGIDNAMFKYPDLPHPVQDINLIAVISNRGGDINNTEIDISRFQLKILQNPLDIKLKMNNLMIDPFIDGEVKGVLDLAALQEVYPFDEGEDLQGKITMNVTTKGNLSSIENEKFDEFTAIGSVLVKGLKYNSEDFKEGMYIRNAQLNFSPAYLDLVDFHFEYKESDMKASGRIEQYLGYALGDKTLMGSFNTNSTYFDVGNFIAGTEGESQETVPDTSQASAFEVPPDIDFQLASSFDRLLYDGVDMENVSGSIVVRDETITIDNLRADVYKGELIVNGSYTTLNRSNPLVDMMFAIKEISIPESYAAFGIMRKIAPVAEHVLGKFSTDLAFSTDLDQEMMPIMASMIGNGALITSKISLENVKSLDLLSNSLNIEELKKLDLNPLNFLFTIEEGKVNVKPFDMKTEYLKANVSGWTAFDQSINYVMKMEVPRELFGAQANETLDELVNKANVAGTNFSLGSKIDVDVLFTGTATDPKVSTSLSSLGKNIVDETKKQVEEELKKKKEEAKKKASEEANRIIAEADAQAQKIIQEAQIKADEVIMAASAAAVEVRSESDKQATKLMDEAKGKGTLAELGAKKGADELKKEGNKRADQLVEEANKQAHNIMSQARAQAKKVKDDAQKRADELNQ